MPRPNTSRQRTATHWRNEWLAVILRKQGKENEASKLELEHARRDFLGKEHRLGADDPSTLIAAYNLATKLVKMEVALDEAEGLARRALAGWISTDSQYVARGASLFVRILRKQGKEDEVPAIMQRHGMFCRGSPDQIGQHTNKTCAKGHGLIRFETPHERYHCDICGKGQNVASIMFGCDKCDYDICAKCEE